MTRNELYRKVSKATGVKQDDVKEIGNAIFDLIKTTVCTGEKVSISKFGTFNPKVYKPHTFFNPLTQEYSDISARAVPKFYPSQDFREGCKSDG